MNTSSNTTYNILLTTLSLATVLAVSPTYADNNVEDRLPYLAFSSYNGSIDYSRNKQSTVDNSTVKNDMEMLKLLEIDDFDNELQSKFKTSIIQTWIPADGILEKSCLFVALKNQEELTSSSKDFELDLYLALEEKISKSNFFDMIALI